MIPIKKKGRMPACRQTGGKRRNGDNSHQPTYINENYNKHIFTAQILIMRLIFFVAVLFFVSCSSEQKSTVTSPEKKEVEIPAPKVYHGSYKRLNDLVHTKLEVTPDWGKMQLNGKAAITLHPHFYSTDKLVLNARGMDLHEVSLLMKDGSKTKLVYDYDQSKISITLDKVYKSVEHYTVFIDYTSKPEELEVGGSSAITKDKGLYFINADGSNPEKPRQLWTQGETESNSAWFPTIEDPQQKMTQEIYITVDIALTTVSNGLLITSTNNNNGTKTDYWKQSLPAAPYLTMIAVSNFSVVKEKWKNIDVCYYLDSAYSKYAKMVFGRTPAMIDCFSKLIGIDYPWEKFAQVVVHDYVSGAMENTTAVVHGTNMQQDSSEYADGNYEDYISHELFHHWFGDLVTCESWSNITLNESFANYGEYIWREHAFGRDDADHLNQNDVALYLLLTKSDNPDLVRYDYDDREDVYDIVSYNKGGRVLHMLRKYVGDEAFYASLKLYLETNKFGSAEVDDLRIAFEKITGEDLNWFFNQWYFKHGHPILEISYDWDESAKTQKVTIEQKQDFEKNPLFRIPLRVDLYHDGKVDRKQIVIEKAKEVFTWKYDSKPDLVNVDAERMLLCERTDNKSKENYVFQFSHAPLYLDRFEALNKSGTDYEGNSPVGKMMEEGLHDPYWSIRVQAMKNIGPQLKANKDKLKPVLLELAGKDSSSAVRTQAIKTLGKHYKEDTLVTAFIESALNDISYNVQAAAFKLIVDNDKVRAETLAVKLEDSNGGDVLNAIGNLYKDEAKETHNEFFIAALNRLRGYERGTFAEIYGKYLKKTEEKTWKKGVDKLAEVAGYSSGYSRNMIINVLDDLSKNLSTKIADEKTHIEERNKNNSGSNEVGNSQREIESLSKRQVELEEKIKKLEASDEVTR
jgi:aminopeptidase N